VEGKHAVLEIVAYDVKGNKIENQYFPVAGATLTGKEVYKYDEKGNISEMTLMGEDGSLISKEIYKYEFDFAGNWNKMTTSVAVIEGGRISFEPTEITYRSIMYYLDDKLLKMAQPTAVPSVSPVANNSSPASVDQKPLPVASKPVSGNTQAATKSSLALPAAKGAGDEGNSAALLAVSRSNAPATSPAVRLESEPPPPPAPRPILKPISGGVLNGTAISLPAPTYPDTARRMRMFGVVAVEVVVDETGKVISATAKDGPNALREVAVQAALRARFSPTKLSGQPVKVSGVINYKFSLAQ
jgi:TonB family protein